MSECSPSSASAPGQDHRQLIRSTSASYTGVQSHHAAVYPADKRPKKLQNHEYMVALYALWYNLVRIHKTLRTSPAMAAGIESGSGLEDVPGWSMPAQQGSAKR
jgi:hypothetical protein